jgi:hypothetical protein
VEQQVQAQQQQFDLPPTFSVVQVHHAPLPWRFSPSTPTQSPSGLAPLKSVPGIEM